MVLKEFNIGENFDGIGLAIDLYTDCGKFHLAFEPVEKIYFNGSLSDIANMVTHTIDSFLITKRQDNRQTVEIIANGHTVVFSPVTLEYVGE